MQENVQICRPTFDFDLEKFNFKFQIKKPRGAATLPELTESLGF